MKQNTSLTENQKSVLTMAATRPDKSIEPLPTPLMGGAKTAMLKSLEHKGLIELDGDRPIISTKGFEAIDISPPSLFEKNIDKDESKTTGNDESVTDVELDQNEVNTTEKDEKPKTKKAQILQLIQRPQGATLDELCDAVEWEKHSVRGSISQLKSQGNNIKSTKSDGQRTYSICIEEEAADDAETH